MKGKLIGAVAIVLAALVLMLAPSPSGKAQNSYPVRQYYPPVQRNNVVQPYYQVVPVPAYSFQYLPAIADYNSSVVPPLSVMVQQEMLKREQLKLGQKQNIAEVVAEVLKQLKKTNPNYQLPDDGMPVVVDPNQDSVKVPPAVVNPNQLPDLTPYAAKVLNMRCARCHTEPGRSGVYFFSKNGLFDPNTSAKAIYNEVRALRMPPGSRLHPDRRPPQNEIDLLKAWAEQQ